MNKVGLGVISPLKVKDWNKSQSTGSKELNKVRFGVEPVSTGLTALLTSGLVNSIANVVSVLQAPDVYKQWKSYFSDLPDPLTLVHQDIHKALDKHFRQLNSSLLETSEKIHNQLNQLEGRLVTLQDQPLRAAASQLHLAVSLMSQNRIQSQYFKNALSHAHNQASMAIDSSSTKELKGLACLIKGFVEVLIGLPEQGFDGMHSGLERIFGSISSENYLQKALNHHSSPLQTNYLMFKLAEVASKKEDASTWNQISEKTLRTLMLFSQFLKQKNLIELFQINHHEILTFTDSRIQETSADYNSLAYLYDDYGRYLEKTDSKHLTKNIFLKKQQLLRRKA